MAAGVGARWTLDQMVATLEPLRQLPTMPESQSQSQSQCSSSSSPCQACALIMSTRARWEKCAATVAPAPSPQPCTGGKPTHAFLFLHSPRASKSLFCVLLIFSWPRICFHLRFSIAASIVLKPPCARTSSASPLQHVAKNNAWVSVQ